MGPYVLRERLGSLDPRVVADADLEPIFRQIPAIHRFPAMMAKQVHALAVHVVERYDGDAARVWTERRPATNCARTSTRCPDSATMKVKALGSVLAKRFGIALAEPLIPWHPTLGDVDSAEALADYQASKKVNKEAWSRATTEAG